MEDADETSTQDPEQPRYPDDDEAPIELSLAREHASLGARFSDFGPYRVPCDYGPEETLDEMLDHPLLIDMSYQGLMRVSGQDSYYFLQTMCTSDIASLTAIGGFKLSLLLTSDAGIIDLIEVVKTGDEEFLIVANAPHAREVSAWLSANARISDDEGAVFPDLSVQDESGVLAQFVMIGPHVTDSLAELSGCRFTDTPHNGTIHLFQIDDIPLMTVDENVGEHEGLRLFFPQHFAKRLWNALLAFPEIQVIGLGSYQRIRMAAHEYLPDMEGSGYLNPIEAGLAHLLRNERDFVGARALEPIQ